MKILLVKTSSLGDVVHTYAAITDALQAVADLEIHWLIEEDYVGLAQLHPGIRKIIPVALRRWRRQPFNREVRRQWRAFRQTLRTETYEAVIDAQGLLKSAWLLRYIAAPSYGYDRQSVREPLASLFYDHRIRVSQQLHAVERTRQLVAKALGYPLSGLAQSGISAVAAPGAGPPDIGPEIWMLHGTTWRTKTWPESYWRQLLEAMEERGVHSVLLYGNAEEQRRAERLAQGLHYPRLQRPLSPGLLAQELAQALAVVSVDSGLGHLAAALGVPVLGLYGPTDTERTGIVGAYTLLPDLECSPCLSRHCRRQPLPEASTPWPPCMARLRIEAVVAWVDRQRHTGRPA